MRKIFYVLSISFLLFQSCSSEDSPNNDDNSEVTVKNVDANTYETVKISNQIWMKSNLNVSHYSNGDEIPQVTDPKQWVKLTTGAWCYNNNDPANGAIYGKLYNWYAVTDPRGLAPKGWHVPNYNEWTTLIAYLGEGAGYKMKATAGWKSFYQTNGNSLIEINGNGDNSSGFTALPGGFNDEAGGRVSEIGHKGSFWSTSLYNNTTAVWGCFLEDYNGNDPIRITDKYYGYSVRCIRD